MLGGVGVLGGFGLGEVVAPSESLLRFEGSVPVPSGTSWVPLR